MTNFETLLDTVDLFKNGRKNSAKAQWESLSREFRGKVIKLIFEVDELKEFPFEDLVLTSSDGILPLTKQVLTDISINIVELAACV